MRVSRVSPPPRPIGNRWSDSAETRLSSRAPSDNYIERAYYDGRARRAFAIDVNEVRILNEERRTPLGANVAQSFPFADLAR